MLAEKSPRWFAGMESQYRPLVGLSMKRNIRGSQTAVEVLQLFLLVLVFVLAPLFRVYITQNLSLAALSTSFQEGAWVRFEQLASHQVDRALTLAFQNASAQLVLIQSHKGGASHVGAWLVIQAHGGVRLLRGQRKSKRLLAVIVAQGRLPPISQRPIPPLVNNRQPINIIDLLLVENSLLEGPLHLQQRPVSPLDLWLFQFFPEPLLDVFDLPVPVLELVEVSLKVFFHVRPITTVSRSVSVDGLRTYPSWPLTFVDLVMARLLRLQLPLERRNRQHNSLGVFVRLEHALGWRHAASVDRQTPQLILDADGRGILWQLALGWFLKH